MRPIRFLRRDEYELRVICRVLPYEISPFRRRFVEGEDGVDRARRNAGAAVDALVGMNIKHLSRRVVGLVLARMNTIHGTDVHAGGILGSHARLADDVRHHIDNTSVIKLLESGVRSGVSGAFYACALPVRELRGLYYDRIGREDGRRASQRPPRRSRTAGSTGCLRRRRIVRPVEAGLLVRRAPRHGRPRLACSQQSARVADVHLTVSRRVAHAAQFWHDDHPLDPDPGRMTSHGRSTISHEPSATTVALRVTYRFSTVMAMSPLTASSDMTGSPAPMVVSPKRGPNASFIVNGMSEVMTPLNVSARIRAFAGARAKRTRNGPLNTRSRSIPPGVSVASRTSTLPMPLSSRTRPASAVASIAPRRTSTSQAVVSAETRTRPSNTRTA